MQTIPEEIIIRSLRQTACEEEIEILNQWLGEDQKNIEYYFQLQEIWQSGKKRRETLVQEGWKKLAAEIENRMPEKNIRISPQKKKVHLWVRYAAAVVVGILIASAVWMETPFLQTMRRREVIVQNVAYNRVGVQSISLPDRSKVWINENTKITYPEKFDADKRVVSLEGKAYFSIRKNPEIPFIVEVGNVDIEVTGTEFFVETAFEDRAFVTLISGSVNLKYKDEKGGNASTALIPGQQAGISKSGEISIAGVDTCYYQAWKDGVFRFENESLEYVTGLLAKRFDLNIRMADSLKGKRFTGRITSEDDIRSVLTTMSKSYPLEYRINGKTVEIGKP